LAIGVLRRAQLSCCRMPLYCLEHLLVQNQAFRGRVTGSPADIGETISARLALNRADAMATDTRRRLLAATWRTLRRRKGKPSRRSIWVSSSTQPSSLLKRLIDPEEVANVVAFVCSREASAVIDASIRVEGGVVLSIA
jgi:hypothetical protein